ncbi:hypothetical protein Tco_0973939 [Tanacetum coccineum]|uniref:Uncharacterized protein n=1 Tax=Tanacetum coccineum TaxID=301880 RepID=A0ABQ5EA72_9ASTR
MLESNAYKTYYTFSSREKALKPKYVRKKADPDTSPKQKPIQDTKDEGTSTIPKVPDVPIYESKSEKESWGNSEDEDNENDSDDISDEGDDDKDGNDGDDDDATDDDKQEEFYKEEEENIDDEEIMYDEEDYEVTKELYEDVNVNLGNEDTEMTNADQGATDQQNKANEPVQSSPVSFDFTSKLLNLENPSPADNEIASLLETSARHVTAVLENTSDFTTTTPPPPLVKQVDQYAHVSPFIPDYVDRYMDNKLGEAINKAILAHNLDCRQEAQDEKNAYIELVDTSMRALIKEEVNTQLPQILPQAVSDFANPVIEKNVTESVEAAVLTRSSSQPLVYLWGSASLSEFKDVFDSYDRGKKRRKSSKEAESSKDSRSKENKSSSTSKDASKSQHKSSGKSAHAEEPSHTVEDSSMQQDQEFVTGDNDEQPANKEVTKADWFKKPERPPTLDPDWSKRPSSLTFYNLRRTWNSQVAHAEEPPLHLMSSMILHLISLLS